MLKSSSEDLCADSLHHIMKQLHPMIEQAHQGGIRVTVSVVDLSVNAGNVGFLIGSEEQYKSASTIKLAIACALLQMVDRGEICLEDQTVVRSEDVVGGSGSLQQEVMPLRATIGRLARLMIAQSDNTATNVLIDVVGFERVRALLEGLGIHRTQLGRKMFAPVHSPELDNYANAQELTRLLKLVYQGELLSEYSRRLLLIWMSKQEVNTKFGAVLGDMLIAHKTGEAGNVTHDTGYFLIPGRELAVAVMTEVMTTEIYEEAQRIGNPVVQRIGKVIYDQLLSDSQELDD
ncbi:serine hydrolase [Paenibacillus provencensis]|uniref:Serine hydrolase n=1 Tax=Paenibacillus provencensis TaxID=441151 RepID=A0ABW3PYY1_9BACL|nr:serine hydrolase [Paenibacillus sp. MER 78]MCM3127493.1 class A beta-lactamase-related serine hydrolase [Paenibacillus sp. MER 78]